MPTVALAARAIGVAEDQIIKSLLFRDRRGCLALAIVAGTGRVDRERLARAAGLEAPRLADAALVLETTGYPAGGVPPVGHRTAIPVVMDRSAAALDLVYGGGGAEEVLLRIRPADVLRLTAGTVAAIVEERP
jgi:Cys-tRNA(Pro)/Cys-tRNA(Cys) deacylase